MLTVEIIYASRERQHSLSLMVPTGTTIQAAIEQSGILQLFPEINFDTHKVGVFSERRLLTDCVAANDRIEIYRPLMIDPKEARRKRATRSAAPPSTDRSQTST